MMLRTFLSLAVLVTSVSAFSAEEPVAMRRGISSFYLAASQLEGMNAICLSDVPPTFEGGPVGEMPVFLRFFADHCKEKFPKCNFGVSTLSAKAFADDKATGSLYATYSYRRADATVGNKIGGCRLAFIDLAQSDLDKTEQQVIDAVEGLTRQSYADLDVVFTYAGIPAFVNSYLEGKTHPVIQWYERIAEHYGVPSINFARNAAMKIQAGEVTAEEYFKGLKWCGHNWHIVPAGQGNVIDSALFKEFIDKSYAVKTDDRTKISRPYFEPISKTNYEHAGGVSYEEGKYDNTVWQEGAEGFDSIRMLRTLLVSSKPGATFSLKFRGSRCGLLDILDKDTADLEYRVNGSPWTLIRAFEAERMNTPIRRAMPNLVEGLDPSKEHLFEIRVAEKQPESPRGPNSPRVARLGVLLIDGYPVDDPFRGLSRIDYIDAVYKRMKPLEFDFGPDRWKFIPKTMEKLQNGGTLRIVMLGDSIIQDSAASSFHLLLERMYPKCKIELIVSTRGATGCWFYKDNNMVEPYVLQHEPDLLMIGGISNGPDLEDVRSVIQQVRAKQNPEIMLMSKVVGTVADMKGHTFEISEDPKDYRNWMRRVAAEENCEFVDMTGPFVQYIRDSGSSYGWYMRDGVHANQRGSQVIGRLLEEYFKPK